MRPTLAMATILALAAGVTIMLVVGRGSVAPDAESTGADPMHEELVPASATMERVASNEAPAMAQPAMTRTMPARVSFAVRCTENADAFWLGSTITASADGEILERQSGTNLEFALPPSVRAVAFHANGYRPVARRVPSARAGIVDFGEVEIEPDAALCVRVSLPASLDDPRVHLRVLRGSSLLAAAKDRSANAGAVTLPVPSDTPLVLSAVVGASPCAIHLAPSSLLLRSGERREVDLQLERTISARLVGMSPQLLEQTTVDVRPASPTQAGNLPPFVLRPDANGGLQFCAPELPCRAFVRCAVPPDVLLLGADGAVDLPCFGGEVTLAPGEPIVGLFVTGSGQAVSSRVVFGTRCETGLASSHVLAREQLEQRDQVVAWVERLGPLCLPVERLRSAGDLRYFDAEAATRLGALLVDIDGTTDGAQLDLVAEPPSGGRELLLDRDKGRLQATLPAGD